MAPIRKEVCQKETKLNNIFKPKSDKKFNPIEDWKAAKAFVSVPRVVSVPESELNSEQLSILKLVKKQCLLSDSEFFKNPLRLIVSGAAGTGKSIVIQHILMYLEEEKKRRRRFDYWAVAPTAVAASTIEGQTIHSQFGLTRFKGDLYEAATKLKKDGAKPNDVYFLIVDEMSMLGRRLFCYMDHYLRHSDEAFNQIPFGGRSVILCGDHWQLRPVKDSALFEPTPTLCHKLGREALTVYQSFNTVRILKTPSRQSGPDQQEFRDLLHRVCRRQATPKDVKLLNSRRMRILPREEQNLFEAAMHVYGKNSGVYTRNE